jgi:hypothetical protein
MVAHILQPGFAEGKYELICCLDRHLRIRHAVDEGTFSGVQLHPDKWRRVGAESSALLSIIRRGT